MKRILIKTTMILSFAVLASGCIKETMPKGSTLITSQLKGSDKAVAQMINGIPAAMMTSGTSGYYSTYGYHGDYGIAAVQMATEAMLEDLAVMGESGYYWFSAWHTNMNQGNDYIWCSFFWDNYYKWIKLANEIIGVVGEVNDETSSDIRQNVGYAHVYRAMFYIDLARLYDPKLNGYTDIPEQHLGLTVPIVKENMTEEQIKKNPRATREEMYSFIFSDLAKAEEYLKDAGNSYTLPSLTAVYGLYARAYIELGAAYAEYGDPKTDGLQDSYPKTSAEAYVLARDYARKAIDKGGKTPLTQAQWEDPKTGFNDGSANNSWIWGLTLSSENVSNLIASIAHRSCEAQYGYAFWTRIGVNKALYEQISDEDFRKHSWLDPDMTSYYSYQFAGSDYDQYVFSYYSTPYESIKFRPAEGNVTDYSIGNTADCCLMRIEEMYFTEIEAEYRVSGPEKARTLLNDFMQEYRYSSYDCTNKTMTEEAFLSELMLQRRIEFWGEGILLYDYKRLNRGITRGYEGTNHMSTARFNCTGRSPQWNIAVTRLETQSNSGIQYENPNPSEKLVLWK